SPIMFKGSKGTLTIPGTAFVDGTNPSTGTMNDPIPIWSEADGGSQIATIRHASGTVSIIGAPRAVDERAKIKVAGGEGWINEGFLTPKDNRPKPTASTTISTSTKTSHSGRQRRRRR